jgi:peptide/nickel transport system substrate-binding protein
MRTHHTARADGRAPRRLIAVASAGAALALAATTLASTASASTPTASASAAASSSSGSGSPSAAADAATPGGTLTIAQPGNVDSMNPFIAQYATPTEIHRLMYDFLTNYSPRDESPIPGLASSWTHSADGLTWTYTIRSGSKWSDGVPVTAHDAAWTYNEIMTNPAAAVANGNFVVNFKSVTAPNDTTLVIQLKRPQATMLALDIPIVPEHIWKNHVKDMSTFNNYQTPVVGDGPYILTKYVANQYIELTANPNYWRGAPKFRTLVFKYYANSDAEVEALRSGEIDFVTGLTPAQFKSLQGVSNITTNNALGKRFYSLDMNPGATTLTNQHFGDGNVALRNPVVRQAIMDGINRQELVTKTLQGYGVVGTGYIPPVFATYHWDPPASQADTYDVGKANTLLTNAGYPLKNGVRMTPQGTPLTLRILGDNGSAADTLNVTYIDEWLGQLGIKATPSIVSQTQMQSEEVAGNYDLAFDGWTVNPDPDAILYIQTCDTRPSSTAASAAGATDDFICDPAYDKLFHEQDSNNDPTSRVAQVKQMEQVLYNDHYINVLYYANQLEAYRSDVIGSMDKQPAQNGVYWGQDGYWAWWSAAPPTAQQKQAAAAGKSKSSSAGATIGIVIGVLVVVLLAGGVVLMRRRRGTAEERE